MITGFNTDVEHGGRVFHVQTEDRGVKHPVIESLVYCGGEIIASRRHPYGEDLEAGKLDEAAIQRQVETQHKRLIREVRNGKFDQDQLLPFGHAIVTNRSFDEAVLAFLHETIGIEQIQLRLTGPRVLRQGASPRLKIEVIEPGTGRPVARAAVSIRLVVAGERTRELHAGVTDDDGTIEVRLAIPSAGGSAAAALLCSARAGECSAEIKRAVHEPRRAPGSATVASSRR